MRNLDIGAARISTNETCQDVQSGQFIAIGQRQILWLCSVLLHIPAVSSLKAPLMNPHNAASHSPSRGNRGTSNGFIRHPLHQGLGSILQTIRRNTRRSERRSCSSSSHYSYAERADVHNSPPRIGTPKIPQ